MNETSLRDFFDRIGPWPTKTVAILGVGPGDPGLITVKGALRLHEADVILYDMGHCPPDIWTLIKPEAEQVFMGRVNDGPRMKSNEVADLILPHYQAGRRVAILKSGDPIVFNRGERDALALAAKGMGFEVVPAPTSALAAASYAGIPVTDRRSIDAVSLAIGKPTRDAGIADPDFAAMAHTGTLAVYMGEQNVDGICRILTDAKLKSSTPVAMVENATRPSQRVVRGDLSCMAATVAGAKISKPALLFFGQAANADEQLRWFEHRPLSGQRVLITRAKQQASRTVGLFRSLGAEVVEAPTVKIDWVAGSDPKNAALTEAVAAIGEYDWLILTSANAVDVLLSNLRDVRQLAGVKIAVVGCGTQRRLREAHIRADAVPAQSHTESLAKHLGEETLQGKRCLLLRSDLANELLPKMLEGLGAVCDNLVAYYTRSTDTIAQETVDDLKAKKIQWATFTSPWTFNNFIALLGEHANDILTDLKLASMGPSTSVAIRRSGQQPTAEARQHDADGLVQSVLDRHLAT